jgi:signal transduction histidine kinase
MKKSFRPSARLIGTIGEDIIKDMHAAVVELVKNSYDADANEVLIIFEATSDKKLLLSVQDDGHGMDENVVVDKWLVPSTSDKLNRRTSPKGRIMQGRKGIGRFAVAVLGEKLKLETVSQNKKTSLLINWDDFVESKYLDEILIEISTSSITSKSGTVFYVEGSNEKLALWNDSEIEYLVKELRKLLTPMDNTSKDEKKDTFEITVQFKNFTSDKYKNETININPLPLLDYYDYRVSGKIFPDGSNTLVYQNKNSGIEEYVSEFNFYLSEKEKFSGVINIDFRIFDRDPEAIENLVYEMFNSGEEKLGKNEAKNLLNDIAGVSIFRNKFRIRPYGDVENDWLSLDKKRVQMPAVRIGANQISGMIEIQDEEISNLVEKSARDGLKEDAYYDGLISVISQLLNFVELKRYSFRQKTGKGRKNHVFSKQIGILTDFSAVKSKVASAMQKANLSTEDVKDVNDFIDNDIKEKLKIAQELEKQIAMYQGQATLGKIMDVVMHEVRKPLQWIKNQTNNLERAYNRYSKSNDTKELDRVMKIVEETPEQLKIITALFKRLNSLATRKRSAMAVFSLRDTVATSVEIFTDEIQRKSIDLRVNMDEDFLFNGWREDILAALANIIENAVYWVDYAKENKAIEISLIDAKDTIEISIWNNGPKIIRDLLDDDSLFNPGISGKVTENGVGTGLGLAIAGEAVDRNGGQIKVIEVTEGAKFLIALPKEEEK